MEFIKDLQIYRGITVKELIQQYESLGFQGSELFKGAKIIRNMISENAKIFLTFTSNMTTSGLRGLFAKWISTGKIHAVVTTAGSIEEDIMKSIGEKFLLTRFSSDDHELHEKGMNRVGNIIIKNDSYMRFEGFIQPILTEIVKNKKRISGSELLKILGSKLKDENSILYQAYLQNVPIFVPGITDGAIGFQLYLAKQKEPDFVIDPIEDFERIMLSITQDDKKGIIALGGGISKHYAILSSLISGGMDYAVYITTSKETSGSASGATTNEGKSWGKIKDDSDSVTIIGDATIIFPLISAYVFDTLNL
ncbi:MAG: deoxyhypusine synthase [Candidatus Woesearchaeota archaeon]